MQLSMGGLAKYSTEVHENAPEEIQLLHCMQASTFEWCSEGSNFSMDDN